MDSANDAAASADPEQPMENFDLLALPQDLLMCVITHASLSPRDVCHLEQLCTTFRELLTDDCWERVFLRERRAPTLGAPSSWKAELAKREEWSRTWRQRGLPDAPTHDDDTVKETGVVARCIAPAVSVCPSRRKLRRLAALVLPGGLGSSSAHADVHCVDPNTPGCFATLNAALSCAKPHDSIVVAPGTYHERLEIDKPVDIVGAGPVGSVSVIGLDGPVVQVSGGRVACRVARLKIVQKAASSGVPMSGAVRVEGGGTLVLEECCIASSSGHCVVIKGCDSCGYILHNEVHEAKGVGVLVCDHARGLIEDNDIARNARAGVAILSGGNPVVRGNKIHNGKDSGVLVSEKGRGRVEENEIFANLRAGVAILREGAPFVTRNKIFDGYDSGVLVCEQGMGSVVDNEIFANFMAGVAIGHGGASTVKGNTIRDGSGGSLLCLSTQSRGLICANVIDQDASATLQVPDGLLPEVQEQNLIRFIGQVHLTC